jgi:hypothetical protein
VTGVFKGLIKHDNRRTNPDTTKNKVRPTRQGSIGRTGASLPADIKYQVKVDFSFSSRGWSYYAEKYGVLKSEFDRFEKFMCNMRDRGELPLNITSADESRKFWCTEAIDFREAEDEAEWIEGEVKGFVDGWTPFSFWDDKDVFLIMLVEKIDLVNLFKPVCEKYRIPIANAKGCLACTW